MDDTWLEVSRSGHFGVLCMDDTWPEKSLPLEPNIMLCMEEKEKEKRKNKKKRKKINES